MKKIPAKLSKLEDYLRSSAVKVRILWENR